MTELRLELGRSQLIERANPMSSPERYLFFVGPALPAPLAKIIRAHPLLFSRLITSLATKVVKAHSRQAPVRWAAVQVECVLEPSREPRELQRESAIRAPLTLMRQTLAAL